MQISSVLEPTSMSPAALTQTHTHTDTHTQSIKAPVHVMDGLL